LAFDWAFGYLFTGPALGHRLAATQYGPAGANGIQGPGQKDVGVNDVIITTARVRYTF
jgi:hypothetical protein